MSEVTELLGEIWIEKRELKRLRDYCHKTKAKLSKKTQHLEQLLNIKSSSIANKRFLKDQEKTLNAELKSYTKHHDHKETNPLDIDSTLQFQQFTRMKIYKTVKERIEEMINDRIEKTFYGKFDQNFSHLIEDDEPEVDDNKAYTKPLLCSVLGISYEKYKETRLVKPGQDEESEEIDTLVEKFYTSLRIGAMNTFDDVRIALANFYQIQDYRRIEFYRPDMPDEIIMSKKEIDKYFKGRGQEQRKLFIMRINQQKKEEILSIKKEEDESKAVEELTDEFGHMLNKIPKLLPFLELQREEVNEVKAFKKNWKNPVAFNENHVCILAMLFLVLILTIFSVYYQRKSLNAYLNIQYLNKSLDMSILAKISTLEKLLELMLSLSSLFKDTSDMSGEIADHPIRIARPMELRFYRVQNTGTCSFANRVCYYEFYNSDTRNESTLDTLAGRVSFAYYLDDSVEYVGSFGEYSRQAYILQLDPQVLNETVYKFTMCSILATTVAAKQYCLNDIFQDCITAQCMGLYFVLQMQFNTPGDLIIDDSVRALALSLDFIEANTKMFLHLEPFCEISSFGVLLPQNFRIIPYFPNFNEGKTFDGNINIIFGFIGVFMIFVIALNIFASHRGGVNFRYLLSLTGLFNIIIMVLIFMHISQINSLDGRGITTSTILTQYNLAEDIKTYDIATTYETIIFIKGLLGGILICRIGLFAKLNSRVEVIIRALERGLPSFILMAGFIIPYVLILSYAGNVIFGVSIFQYKSFSSALASMFKIVNGFHNNEFSSELNWASFIYLFFSIFGVFLLVQGIAYSIFSEAFRFTVIDFGQEFHDVESKWTWKQYLQWSISWVPNKIQSKIKILRMMMTRRYWKERYLKMKQKVEELSRKKEKPSARLGSARNKKGKLDFEEDDSPYKGKKYGKVRYIKD